MLTYLIGSGDGLYQETDLTYPDIRRFAEEENLSSL